MNTEHVVIDDDNDSVETVIIPDDDTGSNRTSNKNNNATIIDTIVLDKEPTSLNGTVVEIDQISNSPNGSVDGTSVHSNLTRNNNLMSAVVEKCLNMEFSEGMTRVVYKTVLPLFRDADSRYKNSARLTRILKYTLMHLEEDPSHKFSHIKSLCDVLKSNKHRKKVPFITLSSKVTHKSFPENAQENYNASQFNVIDITNTNTTKTDIIVLDNSDKESVISVDNNDIDSNDIATNDIATNAIAMNDIDNNDIPNYGVDNKDTENDVMLVEESTNTEINTPITDSNKENRELNAECLNSKGDIEPNIQLDNDFTNNIDNNLLLPQKHEPFREINNTRRVKEIEVAIAKYKKMIAELEEKEVTDNSEASPYILLDYYKRTIVQLYEELCSLVGQEPVKRREVRLNIIKGHRPGPVKRLEEFLNRNIDSTGSPPFPDFCDVVNCVIEANVAEGLCQSKSQVVEEAITLFTQCGKALRKRRQKREWRDLMSLVTPKEPVGDPAETDPQLLARLEENKRIADLKEHEILERYTRMELPSVSPLNQRPINIETRDLSDAVTACDLGEPSRSHSEHRTMESVGILNSDNHLIVPRYDDIPNTDLNLNENVNNSSNSNEICEASQIQVKQEPADIQNLLDGLGSDYSVTVFDIEDPFLVIEISSDSSDDDNS